MENNESKKQVFLSLKNLVKIYPNGEKAVYDFNLDIDKNEFIVIVGPSGCGKSTTLRMIAGFEDISGGDIFLNGELLNYKPTSERKMAMVFQSYALYPQMTVYNNIAFPLTINKYPMPVVNTTLKANAEIEKLLEGEDLKTVAGRIFDIFTGDGNRRESAANVFGITIEAAKNLYNAFKAFSREERDNFISRAEEYKSSVQALLAPLVNAENTKSAENGVKYNDDFCELDEAGNVKIEHRKYSSYEIKKRVYEVAEKLDLVPYLDKLPKELSGGQMQRVALGRAIVKKVPIFMMDEPLSNLDAKLRLTMRSEIVKLHNSENATTIYVTHDQTEAMTMATRIVVMSRGFIQQIGSPEDVYNNPCNIFVAKFIGSPTINVFSVQLDRDEKLLVNGDLRIPVTDGFIAIQDEFYKHKSEEYRALLNNFDEKAKEFILKTLSVTGEYSHRQKHKKEKVSFIKKIKAIIKKFKKDKEPVDPLKFEREVCKDKLEKIEKNVTENHEFILGIRPERIKLEKRIADKKYDNCLIVKPTVCELLGGEYNIHFDFCGRDMVGQIDAAEKITTHDDIVIQFSMDDLYIFDPVTGNVIKTRKA